MRITMMLADSAQAVNGKLYILGGGWSVTGPQPNPSAIAVKVEVPWNETNKKHKLKIELVDMDYRAILVPTPTGNAPVTINCEFEVGRPAGVIPGISIDVPLAFNIGPIPLNAGERYVWKLTVNGKSEEDWQVAFSTRKTNPATK